ncbi:MAG TPA: hypothetical protein PKG88_05935 [Bacteroidales bacterium]|jgi:hypothetical protein|nr:hypothetical protein [Bacteroidales bacterium]HPS71997.1 hypothetical protein [Bacteroidales bacterium]
MEPIPYYYDPINRNAIVVHIKKPFYDWLISIEPQSSVQVEMEGNIYLIKEKDSNEAIENWLKRNYDKIFQNELNDWYTNEIKWPQQRTFKMFKEWFDYKIISMVLDMEETEISKD